MTDQDVDYYARRLREEILRAEASGDAKVASIHQDMASIYADRLHKRSRQDNRPASPLNLATSN